MTYLLLAPLLIVNMVSIADTLSGEKLLNVLLIWTGEDIVFGEQALIQLLLYSPTHI